MGHPALSRVRLGVLAACLLLPIVHTWPLVTDPATLSRNDNGDAQLNEWILAWVAHQLPHAPARLFNANIFYPARDTLAFSEPLIVPAILGMPLAWLDGSPVLVYNIVLILGFALTALAGHRLVHEWTGDHAAGLLAGSLFAFNSHTLTRLAHIQGIHAWGLPLVLLSVDRLIVRTRVRDGLWLALWMAAMAYTSGYLAVFGAIAVAVVVLVRLPEWRSRALQVLAVLGVSAATAAVAMLPVLLPYRRVAVEQNMVRTLDAVARFSAGFEGYIASAGTLHYTLWSKPFFERSVDAFFPGFLALALAGLAVHRVLVRHDTGGVSFNGSRLRYRVVALLTVAAVGVVLSFGTQTPIYGWLFEIFPPIQGLRAASRFGSLFLLGVSALAGIGLALLGTRIMPRRGALAAALLIVTANFESLRAPIHYTRFEGIPPVYSILAKDRAPVVLVEVPFYPPNMVSGNATYVLNSTMHFRPLMNGYSGYMPASYRRYAETFWDFPAEHAIVAMRQAGATHVMVHPARFNLDPQATAAMLERASASPFLERIAIGQNGITLFKVK